MSIWAVVANHSEARIYAAPNRRASLNLVGTLTHEVARAHDRDLASDRPGRTHDRFGPGRHSMEQDLKSEEANKFAREIASRIEAGLEEGACEEFLFIADPHFLGNLRTAMSEKVQRRTIGEVPKNLVAHAPEDVQRELQATLQ